MATIVLACLGCLHVALHKTRGCFAEGWSWMETRSCQFEAQLSLQCNRKGSAEYPSNAPISNRRDLMYLTWIIRFAPLALWAWCRLWFSCLNLYNFLCFCNYISSSSYYPQFHVFDFPSISLLPHQQTWCELLNDDMVFTHEMIQSTSPPLATLDFSSIVKRTVPTTGLPPKKTKLGLPHCNAISKFLTPILLQAHCMHCALL